MKQQNSEMIGGINYGAKDINRDYAAGCVIRATGQAGRRAAILDLIQPARFSDPLWVRTSEVKVGHADWAYEKKPIVTYGSNYKRSRSVPGAGYADTIRDDV